MTQPDGEAAIRRYFEAYRLKDRTILEGLLSEDFTFTSPRDDAIDRSTYFDWCWKNSGHVVGHALERITAIAPDIFLVVYLCATDEGTRFRNAEIFTISAGKIHAVEVYFGPTYREGLFVTEG